MPARLGEGRGVRTRDRRQDEEENREHPVVEREDAQRPSHVEVAEVAGPPLGVDQQSRDEEAREDEEQIDAPDPVVGQFRDGPAGRRVRGSVADEVDAEDHENGHAAYAVEHRPVVTLLRGRRGGCGLRRHGRAARASTSSSWNVERLWTAVFQL